MNIKGMAAMTLALAVSAQAGGKIRVCAADQVVVYVDNDGVVDTATVHRAQYLATRMFARIGVSVKWRGWTPPRGDTTAMTVHMVSGASNEFYPGALGYTRLIPHAGARVFVLVDRLGTAVDPGLTPTLLAHVLVHEITHALEGVNRHAETGVMKARWTRQDYIAMPRKPLEFTPVDVNMIHYRLAHR